LKYPSGKNSQAEAVRTQKLFSISSCHSLKNLKLIMAVLGKELLSGGNSKLLPQLADYKFSNEN
jgi:hypothetical protein